MLREQTAITAKEAAGCYRVNWMNLGSWLIGEQHFSSLHYAREFCSERRLRIIAMACSNMEKGND